MYLVFVEGRIRLAQDHPVNPELLVPFQESGEPFRLVEFDRTMEDALQHVARPQIMFQDVLNNRLNSDQEELSAEAKNTLMLLSSAIGILQYQFEVINANGKDLLPKPTINNLLLWFQYNISLLSLASSEEILESAKKIHTETLSWQASIYDICHTAELNTQLNAENTNVEVVLSDNPDNCPAMVEDDLDAHADLEAHHAFAFEVASVEFDHDIVDAILAREEALLLPESVVSTEVRLGAHSVGYENVGVDPQLYENPNKNTQAGGGFTEDNTAPLEMGC